MDLYAHMACMLFDNEIRGRDGDLSLVARDELSRSGNEERRQRRAWRRLPDVCWVSLQAEQLPPEGGVTFEWRGGPPGGA